MSDMDRPDSWSRRRASFKNRMLLPFYAIEWICEWLAFYLARWAFLSILEYLGRFAVLIAVASYIFGANDRRVQRDNGAWQTINMAYHKSGNAGRDVALETLYHDKADLAGIDLSDSWMIGLDLEGADLHGGTFDESNLTRANLDSASLAGASLRKAFLNEIHLEHANLTEALMRDVHLTAADLRGADLSAAHLEGSVLTDANLEGAKLYNAFLGKSGDSDSVALAIRANFSRADLRYASLEGLDVEGARFYQADLRYADLSTVSNLTQRQVNSAIVDFTTKLPQGLVLPQNH